MVRNHYPHAGQHRLWQHSDHGGSGRASGRWQRMGKLGACTLCPRIGRLLLLEHPAHGEADDWRGEVAIRGGLALPHAEGAAGRRHRFLVDRLPASLRPHRPRAQLRAVRLLEGATTYPRLRKTGCLRGRGLCGARRRVGSRGKRLHLRRRPLRGLEHARDLHCSGRQRLLQLDHWRGGGAVHEHLQGHRGCLQPCIGLLPATASLLGQHLGRHGLGLRGHPHPHQRGDLQLLGKRDAQGHAAGRRYFGGHAR
mmetsp:Transcript_124404/g.346338  ORF Transcript_124404/g.346338 Transcript_124404/m.346338 type:complete len:253 (-) Transcript_124404:297-1055(-)